jgi:hypothetical protein
VSQEELDASLQRLGLPAPTPPPESSARFADGLRYRVEIPSTEGPRALRAVMEEGDARGVPIRRISQGSGVMMLSDAEVAEMAQIGAERSLEVSLFVGPRAAWETGGQAIVTSTPAGVIRGADGLAWCVAEARRAVRLGIRSLLVADVGLLAVLGEMREAGDLPPNLMLKVSVLMPVANPAAARAMERLGAGTLNVTTDLSPAQLGELRQATGLPLDVYVEVPDDQGGFVRWYEVPAMIRACAPMYVKLGLRNSPNIYPVGGHLADLAERLSRERVRRTELVLRLLGEVAPELVEGWGDPAPADLAIPEPG